MGWFSGVGSPLGFPDTLRLSELCRGRACGGFVGVGERRLFVAGDRVGIAVVIGNPIPPPGPSSPRPGDKLPRTSVMLSLGL